MSDVIGFYEGRTLISTVNSSMVPTVDSWLHIQGKNWRVKNVTFEVEGAQIKRMRAHVYLIDL